MAKVKPVLLVPSSPAPAKAAPDCQPRRAFHKKGDVSLTCDSMSWVDRRWGARAEETGFFVRVYQWRSDNDSPGVSHEVKVKVLAKDDVSDIADMPQASPKCGYCLKRQLHSSALCSYMRVFPWPPKEEA